MNASDQLLSIVADGMGGHKAGKVASKTAVSVLKNKWKETEQLLSPEKVESWLKEVITEMNETIYGNAKETEAYEGMGTTVVIAVVSKEFATIAHIGDSRCYIYNENGFKQVTEDHTLVNELVKTGEIT